MKRKYSKKNDFFAVFKGGYALGFIITLSTLWKFDYTCSFFGNLIRRHEIISIMVTRCGLYRSMSQKKRCKYRAVGSCRHFRFRAIKNSVNITQVLEFVVHLTSIVRKLCITIMS